MNSVWEQVKEGPRTTTQDILSVSHPKVSRRIATLNSQPLREVFWPVINTLLSSTIREESAWTLLG